MLPLLKKIFVPLYFGVINALRLKDPRVIFCCVITRKLPKGIKIPHPIGIVIGRENGVTIGQDCVIMQNVTIGVKKMGDKQGPTIGDRVFIGAGAVIVGEITIGNDVSIGAGCVVTRDIPMNSQVRSAAAQLSVREKL